MNSVYYSPEAQNDLSAILEYISVELASPDAARNTVSKITKQIRTLEQFPESGAPLSPIIGMDVDYRFLVCGNYICFYRTEGSDSYIDRVLYSKRDYIKILLNA